MHKLIIILMLLAMACKNNSHSISNYQNKSDRDEPLQLYLQHFDVYVNVDSCKSINSIQIPDSNATLLLDIENCEGQLSFKLLNKNDSVIMEGAYSRSLDTLKKYSVGKSAITGKSKISVYKYFQPLPEGVWTYYQNGNVTRAETFTKGIME